MAIPKIIIKPRHVAQQDSEVEEDSDVQQPDEDADDAEPEGSVVEDEIPEPEPVMRGIKRGRGRPRGRGRASIAIDGHSGTSTPRARGRGRGRGRGRPPKTGAITIRLPKRADDDGDDDDDGPDLEVAGDADVSKQEPEGPIAGGKPFRRIGEKVYVIEGDELILESDPQGDEKVDQWGNLLGGLSLTSIPDLLDDFVGRRYRANTFILPNRHDKRVYMLAIDAARTSGYRDSLYYFRRNPLAYKLNVTQAEKDYLISEGKLGPHLRTRSVTLITARSAYKLHGCKMVLGMPLLSTSGCPTCIHASADGKWVIDDYYEAKGLEECTARGLKAGDPVGDPTDNQNSGAGHDPNASRNEKGNVGGAMGVYRAGGPTTIFGSTGWGPFSDGPLNTGRKALLTRDGLNEENWMWMMAQKVLESNNEWTRCRQDAVKANGGAMAEHVSSSELTQTLPTIHHSTSPNEPYPTFSTGPIPSGAYEPHAGHLICKLHTYPGTIRR